MNRLSLAEKFVHLPLEDLHINELIEIYYTAYGGDISNESCEQIQRHKILNGASFGARDKPCGEQIRLTTTYVPNSVPTLSQASSR